MLMICHIKQSNLIKLQINIKSNIEMIKLFSDVFFHYQNWTAKYANISFVFVIENVATLTRFWKNIFKQNKSKSFIQNLFFVV